MHIFAIVSLGLKMLVFLRHMGMGKHGLFSFFLLGSQMDAGIHNSTVSTLLEHWRRLFNSFLLRHICCPSGFGDIKCTMQRYWFILEFWCCSAWRRCVHTICSLQCTIHGNLASPHSVHFRCFRASHRPNVFLIILVK